jgi:amino acid transporter
MKLAILIALNVALLAFALSLRKKKGLLSYIENGKWWLTWLSVAIITLMDELTSVFYVPAEAYLEVGVSAFVFIIATSVFMRFLSNRMVEIAQILEFHNIRGGGVYSFSYLVLGPKASFIAIASILVTYILTAAISTVAAVNNGMSLVGENAILAYIAMGLIVWGVAGLNILGVRENARFTFTIFIAAAAVLITFLVSTIIDPSADQGGKIIEGFSKTWDGLTGNGLPSGLGYLIFGFASVILAYSGIESVVQTAGLVKGWRDIKKAYFFLAITVGVFTPLLTMMVLTRTDIDFIANKDNLLVAVARTVNGDVFAVVLAILAIFTLIMAVNTAFVASSELLEQVAHRYGFAWLSQTNKKDSLYRIHILNATLFSVIIAVTAGSQTVLAHMYAVGLVASFTINMGSLLYYRYSLGTTEIREYKTSRAGTLVIFVMLLSAFVFIAMHKFAGLAVWAICVVIFMIIGIRVAKRRAPEIAHYQQSDNPMSLIFQCAESEDREFEIIFRRPKDATPLLPDRNVAYVTFYSPRAGSPVKMGDNHYRFPIKAESLASRLESFIDLLQYDFPDKAIRFHLGWPTSSWLDRMSTGVMVFSMMRLPKQFPMYDFVMEYHRGELGPKPTAPDPLPTLPTVDKEHETGA